MGRPLPGVVAAGVVGAGRWRTERTPYLREIMDCLSPASPVQRVALMKGAQIGGTECGNCWIGYVIHQAPGPMMAVPPTVELAKRNSKQRIDPLIEESEVLRELVKERRSRDSGNTVLSKEFPGGADHDRRQQRGGPALDAGAIPNHPCRELLVAGRPWRYLISETCADVAGCGRCSLLASPAALRDGRRDGLTSRHVARRSFV